MCEKVEGKGRTTYTEVADELVAEMAGAAGGTAAATTRRTVRGGAARAPAAGDLRLRRASACSRTAWGAPPSPDAPAARSALARPHPRPPPVRRRVYDAINVLMALGAIAKESKAIIWRGLAGGGAPGGGAARAAPRGAAARAAEARDAAAAAVEAKAALLADLAEQHAALEGLLARNRGAAAAAAAGSERGGGGGGGGGGTGGGRGGGRGGARLYPPFILLQARPDATVQVAISDDLRDVQFDFGGCARGGGAGGGGRCVGRSAQCRRRAGRLSLPPPPAPRRSPFRIHDDVFATKALHAAARAAAAKAAVEAAAQAVSPRGGAGAAPPPAPPAGGAQQQAPAHMEVADAVPPPQPPVLGAAPVAPAQAAAAPAAPAASAAAGPAIKAEAAAAEPGAEAATPMELEA